MRAVYLANYFVAGCAASSLLGWIASLHPMAMKVVSFLLIAISIAWVLGWLLDYSIAKLLRVSIQELQALMVSILAVLLIGLGVVLCT